MVCIYIYIYILYKPQLVFSPDFSTHQNGYPVPKLKASEESVEMRWPPTRETGGNRVAW